MQRIYWLVSGIDMSNVYPGPVAPERFKRVRLRTEKLNLWHNVKKTRLYDFCDVFRLHVQKTRCPKLVQMIS